MIHPIAYSRKVFYNEGNTHMEPLKNTLCHTEAPFVRPQGDTEGRRKPWMFLVPLILLNLLPGALVFAHATALQWGAHVLPLGSEERLTRAPERVRIRFSGRPDPVVSTVTITSPDGVSAVYRGKEIANEGDPHVMSVEVADGGRGTYKVVWHVLSADDGHSTEGSFDFFVEESAGAHGAAHLLSVTYSSGILEGIGVALELLGLALLSGGLAGVLMFRRMAFPTDAHALQTKLRHFLSAGCCLILLGITANMLLKGMELRQWEESTTLFASLHLYSRSTAGISALLRAVLSCLSLLLILKAHMGKALRRPSAAEVALWGSVLLMVFLRTSVSHAAATAFHPHLSLIVASLHLLSKILMVGLTLAVAHLFLPAAGPGLLPLYSLYSLYSRWESVAIGVTGITGLYITKIFLKDPGNLFQTSWGIRFIILTILAAILLLLRFRSHAIAQRCPERISRALSLEALVGATLLLLVGILMATATPLGTVGVHLGPFELLLMLLALPITFTTCWLYRGARKLVVTAH